MILWTFLQENVNTKQTLKTLQLVYKMMIFLFYLFSYLPWIQATYNKKQQ